MVATVGGEGVKGDAMSGVTCEHGVTPCWRCEKCNPDFGVTVEDLSFGARVNGVEKLPGETHEHLRERVLRKLHDPSLT